MHQLAQSNVGQRRLSRLSTLLAFAIVAALGTASAAQAKRGKKDAADSSGKIEITWLGHAAFEVVSPKGTRILIDPFLSQNPSTPEAFKALDRYAPKIILVTHSHGDHVGDTVAIAKASKALVVGAHDHISAMKDIPADQLRGGNVGGMFQIDDVTIRLVPAMHGSTPGGRPLGFVISFDNKRSIYHSGDTWIFTDMGLIQELYKPEILLLQAGGGPYNQAPEVAALAVKKFFKPKHIIPMHFGTFGALASGEAVDAAFKGDKRYHRMQPGETAKY